MIRRAAVLGLLALAAPLAAAAQATPASGKVTFNDSYVGVSACSADQEVLMSWLASLTSGKTYPTTDARYDIFASSQTACPTGTTTVTLATGYTGASTLSVQSYPGGQGTALGVDTAIAFKLGFNCTDTTDHTVYVCVNLYSAADTATTLGTAAGTFQLQLTAPAAPTGVGVTASDTALHVSWTRLTGTPTVKDYRARATNAANTTEVHYSGWVADPGTSTTITGLTNNVTYDIAVQARSLGENEGPWSTEAVQGTPIPIDDFWAYYKNAGGREVGGCGTAGGEGILAALGLLALALRARRRS